MNLTLSLSLFSLFLISSLLLHNSLSFSHHISLSRWAYSGMGSAWVAQAHWWWAVISRQWWVAQAWWWWPGFCVCGAMVAALIWWWHWSSGSSAMCVVFWSALIWVLLNNSVCSSGILVGILINNCLGLIKVDLGFYFYFLNGFLFQWDFGGR